MGNYDHAAVIGILAGNRTAFRWLKRNASAGWLPAVHLIMQITWCSLLSCRHFYGHVEYRLNELQPISVIQHVDSTSICQTQDVRGGPK